MALRGYFLVGLKLISIRMGLRLGLDMGLGGDIGGIVCKERRYFGNVFFLKIEKTANNQQKKLAFITLLCYN